MISEDLPKGQLFQAIDDTDLLKQAEVMSMRAIADSLRSVHQTLEASRVTTEATVRAVQDMRAELKIVSDSVIRLQEQTKEFTDLRERNRQLVQELADVKQTFETRLKALESDQDRRNGAMNFAKMVKDFWPVVFALAVGMTVFFKERVTK